MPRFLIRISNTLALLLSAHSSDQTSFHGPLKRLVQVSRFAAD